MVVISLHKIVTNILLTKRYPDAYYIDFLVLAKDGLATLVKGHKIITSRYKCLPLNDNHAIEIPNDYMDWTSVSVRIGQYLHRLVPDNELNLVPNYDSDFVIQPYSSGVATDTNNAQYSGYLGPYWWMVNWNVWGEGTGRQFGGLGARTDTFKENRARNEIKINENLDVTEVVLEYVSNGMDADSATHIDWYAKDAITAYCMWQFKENNRTYSDGQAERSKQYFDDTVVAMRAELSDLTVDTWRRIIQKNSIAIKT